MKAQLSDHFNYRKLISFTYPSILSTIFTSLYTIVDGIFVSNLVGDLAFAGLNLVWPPLGILQAFGFMIGTGGAALASRYLGERREKKACEIFTMLAVFALLLGIVLTLLVIFFIGKIAVFLGASEAMLPYCIAYGRPLALLMVFTLLTSTFNPFLITNGKSRIALLITLSGGVLNMILDYVFIAWLQMGIAGAAWATGLNWVLTSITSLFFFKKEDPLHFVRFKTSLKDLGKVLANGSSEMVSNVSLNLVAVLYNYVLMQQIGSDGVVVYGILQYIAFVFVSAYLGYSFAIIPVVGYHYGANHPDELRNILIRSIVLVEGFSIFCTLGAELLAPYMAMIFVSYSQTLMELSVHAIHIYALSFLISGFNILASSFFTGLNNGPVSATISFCRTFLFQVIAVLIMPLLFGIDGVWNAINVAEVLSFALALFFLLHYRKRYGY